jgi:hypothetical protein
MIENVTSGTCSPPSEGPGMRWDADNAEAIMALEAMREGGSWKPHW